MSETGAQEAGATRGLCPRGERLSTRRCGALLGVDSGRPEQREVSLHCGCAICRRVRVWVSLSPLCSLGVSPAAAAAPGSPQARSGFWPCARHIEIDTTRSWQSCLRAAARRPTRDACQESRAPDRDTRDTRARVCVDFTRGLKPLSTLRSLESASHVTRRHRLSETQETRRDQAPSRLTHTLS